MLIETSRRNREPQGGFSVSYVYVLVTAGKQQCPIQSTYLRNQVRELG